MSGRYVVDLDELSFSAKVESGVVLVDFWAPWCGPCRMLSPVLEDVGEALEGLVTIAKVNVDESPRLAAAFGVRSIPSLFVFSDGQVVEQLIGVQSKESLIRMLRRYAVKSTATV